ESGITGKYGTLEFTAVIDKSIYSRGESVLQTFTVRNTGSSEVAFTVGPSISFREIFRGGTLVWGPRGGGSVGASYRLGPGQQLSESGTWDQIDESLRPVGPGTYTIILYLGAGSVDGRSFELGDKALAAK